MVKLLAIIKAALPELEELRDRCARRVHADASYRFYRQSDKLFGRCQLYTKDIVGKLRSLSASLTSRMSPLRIQLMYY